MSTPQEIEGGIRIDDAESVGLCPWVEFYPDVVGNETVNEYLFSAISLVTSLRDLGINSLDAEFCRVKKRSDGMLVALKFGYGEFDEWTSYSSAKMFGVDVDPIIEAGIKLDGIVDFNHNNEVVIYTSRDDLSLHIDRDCRRPISVRRCLLTLDGQKTNIFEHPKSKQIISSVTPPGSAVSFSYGAIRHGVNRTGESYSMYIQSDK